MSGPWGLQRWEDKSRRAGLSQNWSHNTHLPLPGRYLQNVEWKQSRRCAPPVAQRWDKRMADPGRPFPHHPALCLGKGIDTNEKGATEGWGWKTAITRPEIKFLNLNSCKVGRTECFSVQFWSKCRKNVIKMHSLCWMCLIKAVTQLSRGKVFTKIVDIPFKKTQNPWVTRQS